MSSFNYQNSTITKYRAGTSADPYIDITESKKVINGVIQLNEIPVSLNKVRIAGYYELPTSSTSDLAVNEYRVDYAEGLVYFNVAAEGLTLTAIYKGRGNHFVSVNRIWTENDGLDVIQTLGDIIDAGRQVIDELPTLNQTIDDAHEATADANTAAAIADAKAALAVTATTNANTATSSANTATGLANTATSQANTARDSANAAASAANTAKTNADAATGLANTAASNADDSADNADLKAAYALEQGDYAKAKGDYAAELSNKGEYDNGATYKPLNIVVYNDAVYQNILQSTGVLPTNTTYWKMIMQLSVSTTWNSVINKVDASTTEKGIVQLIDNASTPSTTLAPTANALKVVNDTLNAQLADTDFNLNGRGINVMYPPPPFAAAVGDDSANDTSAIQNIINALQPGETVVIPKGFIFRVSSLLITDKHNLRITGGGTLRIFGANAYGLSPRGTVSYLEIDNLEIIGDAGVNYHTAIGNPSGQVVSYVKFHDLTIKDVNVAISLNADLSGSYDIGWIYNNDLQNIVGTDVGNGYGIHLANAYQIEIYQNKVDRSQRHAMYQARGENNNFHDNVVTNHRLGVATATGPRAAFNIVRSKNIKSSNNTFIDCFDAAINVTGETSSSSITEEILIENSVIINPKNTVYAIFIGEQLRQGGVYTTKHVTVKGTKIYADASSIQVNALTIHTGFDIKLIDNEFHFSGVNGLVPSAINVTHSSFAQDYTDADLILVQSNRILFEGANTANCRAIVLQSGVCGTNGIRCTIEGNDFIGLFTPTGKAYSDYYLTATATNPELRRDDTRRRASYASAAPTTGYHIQGESVNNDIPSLTKNISHWDCIVTGTPGVWNARGCGTGTTGQRPTLTTNDAGYLYRDTSTGTIVFWNGTAWI